MSSEFLYSANKINDVKEKIDARRYLGEMVSGGWDSDVYRSRDRLFAIKLYKRLIWSVHNKDSFRRLSFYKTITNKASELVKKENWQLRANGRAGIPIEVVPMKLVYKSNYYGCFVSVSPFVEGPALIEYNDLSSYSKQVYNAVWRQFGELDKKFNRKLGTEGIGMGSTNIKILGSSGQHRMLITDLCNHISRLGLVKS